MGGPGFGIALLLGNSVSPGARRGVNSARSGTVPKSLTPTSLGAAIAALAIALVGLDALAAVVLAMGRAVRLRKTK
jgi:hypothetical protein